MVLGFRLGPHEAGVLSPLVNSNYQLARQMAAGEGLRLDLPYYGYLPPDVAIALSPRDAALVDGTVVPKAFLPEILTVAGLLKFDPYLLIALAPLLGGVAVLGVFAIGYQLASSGGLAGVRTHPLLTGGIAAGAFALLPSQWIVSSRPFGLQGLSVTCLICAMAIAIPMLRPGDATTRSVARGAIVGALFALSVAFRYPNLIIVALPLAALLHSTRNLRMAAALVLPLVIVGISLALMHYLVYGSPMITGHQLAGATVDEAVTFSSSGYLDFNRAVFITHLKYYLTAPEFVGLAYVGIVVAAATLRSSSWVRTYAIIAVGTFVPLLLMYSGQETHGVAYFAVNASLMRYLLPGIALLIPLAVYGAMVLVGLVVRRNVALGWAAAAVAAGALSLVFFTGVMSALDDTGGVRPRRAYIGRVEVDREAILGATDERSLIITRLHDKLLFPDRYTLVATLLIGPGETIDQRASVVWEFVPSPERLADVAARINDSGYRVFLLNDGVVPGADFPTFAEELVRRGYIPELVDADVRYGLYELVPLPDSTSAP